jgi:hypothetical protein
MSRTATATVLLSVIVTTALVITLTSLNTSSDALSFAGGLLSTFGVLAALQAWLAGRHDKPRGD